MIQEIAKNLSQPTVTLDRECVGDDRLADLLDQALNGKTLRLSDVKLPVPPSETHLRCDAVAKGFHGARAVEIHLQFFVEEKLECVFIAKLPDKWNFAWAYPFLPGYMDARGEDQPSIFENLRFQDGLKVVFSSCKIPPGRKALLEDFGKSCGVAVKWDAVMCGLKYLGQLEVGDKCSYLGPAAELAKFENTVGAEGALYLNEKLDFADEIWLRIDLHRPKLKEVFGLKLPFEIEISGLVLSTTISLNAPQPGSAVWFIAGIKFSSSSKELDVLVTWSPGSKNLIISNVDRGLEFPGFDALLDTSEAKEREAHETLAKQWKAGDFTMQEIVFGFSWEPPRVTILSVTIELSSKSNASFLGDFPKEFLAFKGFTLRLDIKPNLEIFARADFILANARVYLAGTYPALAFSGGLSRDAVLDLNELLKHFLPAKSLEWLSGVEVRDLLIQADFGQHIYSFDLELTNRQITAGDAVRPIVLESLRLSLALEKGSKSVMLESMCMLGNIGLHLQGTHIEAGSTSEWIFYGELAADHPIKFGELIEQFAEKFGGHAKDVPEALETFAIQNVRAEFQSGNQTEVRFHCEGKWEIPYGNRKLPADLVLSVERTTTSNKERTTTFEGNLTVGTLDFAVTYKSKTAGAGASSLLLATYQHKPGESTLGDVLRSFVQDEKSCNGLIKALDSVTFDLKTVWFAWMHNSGNLLVGFEASLAIGLEKLPLVGGQFPAGSTIGIEKLQVIAAKQAPTEEELTQWNGELGDRIAASAGRAGAGDPGKKIGLKEGINISLQLSSSFPPAPLTARPAGAGDGAAANAPPPDAAAPSTITKADNATWAQIQKSIGPVHFERIGVQYEDGRVSFLLDASLIAAGLTLSLDGLTGSCSLKALQAGASGFSLNDMAPAFDLHGLGIDYRKPPLEIGGAFLKQLITPKTGTPYWAFSGMATVRTKTFTLSAIGSYANIKGNAKAGGGKDYASLFMYAVLDYPIGGPPFFFVTGLAAAFGYNRSLTIPTIDNLVSFPLIAEAIREGGPQPLPADHGGQQATLTDKLNKLEEHLSPAPGQNFLAVGIKFTSFKTVESFALLVVKFGTRLEFDLLGLSTLQSPPASEGLTKAEAKPIVRAQLALKATYIPDDGFLGVQAQLTRDSYLLSESCHLSGGFAFFSWFKESPDGKIRAGDFVLTLGGYHRDYRPLEHYPRVPRLAFSWQVTTPDMPYEFGIKGDGYFALTPHAVMAGGHLEAVWHSGDLRAWFNAGVDFLMNWKPYHYDANAYVEIGASYTFDLFGSHTITIDVGADLHIWGPEFAGKADLHCSVFSVTVYFGKESSATATPIEWPEFRRTFLPKDERICSVSVQSGLIREIREKDGELERTRWIVSAKDFKFTTNSTIPLSDKLSIAPMGVSNGISSDHAVRVARDGQHGTIEFTRIGISKPVPAGLWGEPRLEKDGKLKPPELNPKSVVVEGKKVGYEMAPAKAFSQTGSTETITLSDIGQPEDGMKDAYRWQDTSLNDLQGLPAWNQAEKDEGGPANAGARQRRMDLIGALGFSQTMLEIRKSVKEGVLAK